MPDPIPTFLLTEFINPLLLFQVQFCNALLVDGCLTESQKPAIKKPGMDPDSIKHYHPFQGYQEGCCDIWNCATSCRSFMKGTSSDTVLLKLISDICNAIDTGQVMLLCTPGCQHAV